MNKEAWVKVKKLSKYGIIASILSLIGFLSLHEKAEKEIMKLDQATLDGAVLE